ncbi:hypothetical protein IJJ12_00325 [bacterium]|nr:hypothetical protein [bacterium]
MPELPEVETVVRSLRGLVQGQTITKVTILHPKSFPDVQRKNDILNKKIVKIARRAKLIIFDLDNDLHLLVHLKMTGQLLYKNKQALAGGGHPTSDILAQLPGKHTRVMFDLDSGGQLFFNDQRIFGWVRVVNETQLADILAAYGPDANDWHGVDAFYQQLQRRSMPIKQVLLDNKVVAGIGNIYAAEICFAAGAILSAAIANGGTTFDGRYVDAYGNGGNFEKFLQVYGREGEACRRCGGTLSMVKLGGRSTVFCPVCQK